MSHQKQESRWSFQMKPSTNLQMASTVQTAGISAPAQYFIVEALCSGVSAKFPGKLMAKQSMYRLFSEVETLFS